MKKKKKELIEELRRYSESRKCTPMDFIDGVRQHLIAEELTKQKVNWKEL